MRKYLYLIFPVVLFVQCGEEKQKINEDKKIEKPVVSDSPKTISDLGEKLFFDTQLSLNESISCATCHIPEYAFADTTPFSIGVEGRLGKRNTPSSMNMASRSVFFYDGRAATLEEQAIFPIEDHLEMSVPIEDVLIRLSKDADYANWFAELFKDGITKENLGFAIAEYERTLETSNTPFDRYMEGDDNAVTASQKRGHQLFLSQKAKCFDCHFGPDFTGDEFRNIGLYDEVSYLDKGRFNQTQDKEDLGKFKVPGLRNVAVTGPYMHDGSIKTLREVLEFYNDPYSLVKHPINLDSIMIEPLGLSNQELEDLENFLISLTDDQFADKLK